MQRSQKWTLLLIGIAGACVLAYLFPSTSQSRTAVEKSTVQSILQADDFLVALNSTLIAMSSAPTSLVRDEVKAASTRNLNSLLQGKLLEAVVTIHDVKMKNSHTATLTVGGFDTPKLAQEKNISFSILSGPISIDLPMTLETARNIKPGQRLLLRGAATYEPGNMIAIIMPWRSAFMRLNFHGPSQQGAIIALAPTEFRFVETSNDVSRPPPISPTNAPKPKVIAPVAKRADSYSELHSSFANKFRYHHEGARLCQTPQPVAMRSENGFLINMMARRKPVF